MSANYSPQRSFVVAILSLVLVSMAITSASALPSRRNVSARGETHEPLESAIPSDWKAYQDPYWNLQLRYPADWNITSIPYQGFGIRFSSPDLHIDEQGNVTQGGYFWIDVAPETGLTTKTGTISQGIETLHLAHGYSYRTRFLHVPSPSASLAVNELIVQSLDMSNPPSQYPPLPFNETDLDVPLKLPFPSGPAFIASGGGYNNGDNHVNVDRYALDFCMPYADDCQNNSYVVIAPTNMVYVHSASGRRDFHFFKIAADIGAQFSLCMSLAHFSLDVPLSKGDSVPQGAALGRLSGYNPPHRHMGIWVAPASDDDCVGLADGDYLALPFIDQSIASPNGDFRLEGQSYPVCDDDGCDNAHASKPVESTNVPFCYNPLREHGSSPSAPNSRAGADVDPIDCFPPDRAFLPLALVIPPPPPPWIVLFEGDKSSRGHHVIQTGSGDFVVAGIRMVGSNAGLWVVKLGSDGQVRWQQTYASSLLDQVGAIIETSDGGYVITGGSASPQRSRAWILKLNSAGLKVWQRTLARGYDYFADVMQLEDGRLVVAGSTGPPDGSNTNGDAWIVFLDSAGNVTSQKVFGLNGRYDTFAFASIAETSDGGFLAAGSAGEFGCDLVPWLVKFDSNLSPLWQKSYAAEDCAYAGFVKEAPDGTYVFAGEAVSFSNGDRQEFPWIMKLRNDGSVVWQKSFLGPQGVPDWSLFPAQLTGDGGVLLGGDYVTPTSARDGVMMKLSPQGDIVWQQRYGDNRLDYISSVVETVEGDYVATGTTFIGSGQRDNAWVLRVGPDGRIPGCNLVHDLDIREGGVVFQEAATFIPTKAVSPQLSNLTMSSVSSAIPSSYLCGLARHNWQMGFEEMLSTSQTKCNYPQASDAQP